MAAGKNKYRVLVADAGDKVCEYIAAMLPPCDYEPVIRTHGAGETRRMLLSAQADIVIINTPLPDEFGTELAVDLSDGATAVMLLVRNESCEQICGKVEESGVLTVGKPSARQTVYSSIRLLTAMSARLARMEKKNRTLQDKMDDIRTVNRAKWLLIENLSMNESSAHYYIEKQAMDTRLSRREVAENIIRTYDK